VAVSELFPLTVGMSWTYRVSEKSGSNPGTARNERQGLPVATTSVLEQQPGHPGVFRLRTEMDGGLAWTRLVTVTSRGTLTLKDEGRDANDERATAGRALRLSAFAARPPTAAQWKPEISLPADARTVASETVRVPAGEYQTVRAVQRSPSGETATVWLAPGVGIVRRAWDRTGLVEELEAFRRPAPEQDGHTVPPSAVAGLPKPSTPEKPAGTKVP